MLRAALSAQGYSLRIAADGAEGMEAVHSWKPDLVITDVSMPQMNGVELCREIRTISQIPIIVLSVLAIFFAILAAAGVFDSGKAAAPPVTPPPTHPVTTQQTTTQTNTTSSVQAPSTTLKPGDMIMTGTPTGAGGHFDPPKWLVPGDTLEIEVPEIGVLKNTVVDEK